MKGMDGWWGLMMIDDDDDDDINANKRRCWSILEMHKQIGQNSTKKKKMRKNSAATRARRNVEKQSSGIYVSPYISLL